MVAKGSKTCLFQLTLMVFCVFCSSEVSIGSDTILLGQSLYANQTLISKEGKFELGFFSPGNSSDYYVGIWYKNIPVPTVVWVLGRKNTSYNSRLLLSEDGNLILFNNANMSIWSVNFTGRNLPASKGVLLDTGNFVLSDGLEVIWQSFDYPTDTLLPGAKVGIDKTAPNTRQVLTSWRSRNDPSPGIFSLGLDPKGSSEFYIWRNQSIIIWRSGAWNGSSFGSLSNNFRIFSLSYLSNDQTSYFTISEEIYNYMPRITINYAGQMQFLIWSERDKDWVLFLSRPADQCEVFGLCGAYGVCNVNKSPTCSCLKGFEPKFPKEWSSGDTSGGCVRKKLLTCEEGYLAIKKMKFPANSEIVAFGNAEVCRYACSLNCSCFACAISDGRCLQWYGDLLDLQLLSTDGGVLYLKSSEVHPIKSDSGNANKLHVRLALSITLPVLICISLTCLFCHTWRKIHSQRGAKEANQNLLLLNLDISSKDNSNNMATENIIGGEENPFDLPQFSFSSISAATDNFSEANKLGEGGFGPVFKGNLLDGHSVAVKRLSKRSGQGLEELKNETVLIAKLQHRNLVRLLGCCIEQDEKILIYEYMPNKSLDCFLFDPNARDQLDWKKRVQIIDGIAQGLLYLHQHSRLRIIHRDLKASNILLDRDMNPKISDFGMARIFGGDVLQANTKRIVGTYGYMSPEYAMEGLFSIKSDVFAFGVLLLEIISGKKNTGFHHSNCLSLLGHAWELWKNEKVLDLIDPKLQIPYSSSMPLRYIHVGLLCVQESAADRPTMSDVLAMFSNENMQLVSPKRPAFTGGSSGSVRDEPEHCSLNNLTASVMDGR